MTLPPAPATRRVSVDDDLRQRYDARYFALYYLHDPKRAAMYRQEQSRIERLKSSGRILDVGCGLGSFLEGFPSASWQKYGVDISPVAVEGARARGIHVNDPASAFDYPSASFDVIVLRGSLQLLPSPFETIQTCIGLLAADGLLVFLATPNSNSPYYRRFKTLPFLTPEGNYLIPSDIMLRNALQNFGMEVLDIQYPYWDTPYASPWRDHMLYALSFLGLRRKFAFWRSAMEVYARKPSSHPTLQ